MILPPSDVPTPKWASDLVRTANARNRARNSAEIFSLDDLKVLWVECGGRCSASRLPFSLVVVGDGQAKHPFAPSLDRKDRHQPYTRNNTWLVTAVANFAMNAWGLDPVLTLASGIHKAHGGRPPAYDIGPGDAEVNDEAVTDGDDILDIVFVGDPGGQHVRHDNDHACRRKRVRRRIADPDRFAAPSDQSHPCRTRHRLLHYSTSRGAADTGKFTDLPGDYTRISVGGSAPDWASWEAGYDAPAEFVPDGETRATDPLLLYFTSGTAAKPKLVLHSHQSYPVGHLSTMYYLGVRPGDIHLNISSPGWAKHAYSCVFAPWNAGATVFMLNQPRFNAKGLLDALGRCGVTTFCAPPTVWRMLIQEDLKAWKVSLREALGAGEPLNPEIIEQVRAASGVTVRDGYRQTETTLQIGNFPGQKVKPGSMGRAAPGYRVRLVDAEGAEQPEAEVCLALDPPPLGRMQGYQGEDGALQPLPGAIYRTGDVATVDADGYFTYIGRADDVFKASDYRISPFELESALIEHPAVAEAAIVPSPDPLRLALPKAFIVLAGDNLPTRDTALAIFRHCRAHLAPYKRVRRLEFAELPKTISGKIRRVKLRMSEAASRQTNAPRAEAEFWEEDFPELR